MDRQSTSGNKPLSLIVACDRNRVMGRSGKLPWSIPEDHAWFHEMTHGKTVVLGRICYETWPRAHADGRRPVVITSRSAEELHPYPAPPGAEQARLAHSVREALRISRDLPGEILICGGARIFEETLPLASKLYLTSVDAEVSGDVLFPEWRQFPWRETWRREGRDQNFSYTMSVLEKDPEPSR